MSFGEGALFAAPGSSAAPLARALAWLWRLGPVEEVPKPTSVGVGVLAESPGLRDLVRSGQLAGAVVLTPEPGAPSNGFPARRRVSGVARFDSGLRVSGAFTVFEANTGPAVSSLGCHAVREDRLLTLGIDHSAWGRVDFFWALAELARFLVETLDRPLIQLPPIGCLRLDDFPGTAELQLSGKAQSDRRQRRRLDRVLRTLNRFDARLVVAVAAYALDGKRPVPLQRVWPRAVERLADAVGSGALEAACHGTLHLDTDALARGVVEPREFARLDAVEAGRRLDDAIAWLREHIGQPVSFAAPAWGYSAGSLEAAAERGLPSWLPPTPAPLLEDALRIRETLSIGLPGLHRLDYRPLERLAAAGLPPTVVFHGALLDHRLQDLKMPRDTAPLLRLAVRRDLYRIPRLRGVRWVSAGELIRALRAHDRVHVDGTRVELPRGAQAIVRDRAGSRLVHNGSHSERTVESRK